LVGNLKAPTSSVMCAYHSSVAESTIIQEMEYIKKEAYDFYDQVFEQNNHKNF